MSEIVQTHIVRNPKVKSFSLDRSKAVVQNVAALPDSVNETPPLCVTAAWTAVVLTRRLRSLFRRRSNRFSHLFSQLLGAGLCEVHVRLEHQFAGDR